MDKHLLRKKDVHTYLEGTRMTLSDVIISFYILEYSSTNDKFVVHLPDFERLMRWLNVMKVCISDFMEELSFLPIEWVSKISRLRVNDTHQVSLINGLEKMNISAKNITDLKGTIFNDEYVNMKQPLTHIDDITFDWDNIHEALRPTSSAIPQKRQQKKTDQLLNMVLCANKMVKPGMIIVDFCSGGGHLGLLMAAMHKDCTVVLLENKEESLSMAESRIADSGLDNLVLYKCNIYAYKGHFDIGLALHACGTVTDLVMEICLSTSASMVISPCCYGNIGPSPNVDYPRSVTFSKVDSDTYSKCCHAADCCNAEALRLELSREAMHLIDSDRSCYASEKNYRTQICRMTPEDCTPKNNILVYMKI